MINLTPIAANIQRRLFEKMRVLGRDPNEQVGSTNKQKSKDTNVGLTHGKMATRSTFIRMCSGQVNPVVLHGGKLKDNNNIPGGYDEIYGPRTYKSAGLPGENIEPFDEEGIINEAAGLPGVNKSFSNPNNRPMPGVKSADISFKGGVRALREATVQWTCWDWEELNLLMPHFLAHGKTVLLEWGWVYDGSEFNAQQSFISLDNFNQPYIDASAYDTSYKDKVIDENGDFDMMVGIIKNFEFTTRDDGGFDCTTIITSVGASILDNPEPNEVALDPGVAYNTSVDKNTEEVFEAISNVVGNKGVEDETEAPKAKAERQDTLVDLDTTLSLKLMISKLDNYIMDKVKKAQKPASNDLLLGDTSPVHYFYGEKNKWLLDKTIDIEKGREDKLYETINNVWVRWGWFEDNILSKFLSMVTKPRNDIDDYPDILTEFRSIEEILTPERKGTGRYESVRIKNHAELQTTNINNHIMPGQFYPVESKSYIYERERPGSLQSPLAEGKIEGDERYLIQLAKIVNDKENYDMFATPDEITVKTITEDELILKETAASVEKRSKKRWFKGEPKKELYDTGKDIVKEQVIPGKYGYLRNMLINTKVIRTAFGVGDDFNVESINIVESLESLFSILNRELNFWSFSVVTDEIQTNRAKIIDNQVVDFDFDKRNPVTNKQSFMFGEDVITDVDYEPGVFYFPVWQKDSLVKRQNITAKIPDELQLSIMYGTNLDQLRDFANPGAAFGNKEGVFAGALFNSYNDIKNSRMDIAFRSEKPNLGTSSGNANEELSNNGDDIRQFIIQNSEDLELKLEDRLKEINDELKIAENEDIYGGLEFDESTPPPIIRDLSPTQLGDLLKYEQSIGLFINYEGELGKLFGSMFDTDGNMKPVFKKSVGFLTTQHGIYKNSRTPLLIPLELELDIDGIGGIFPGNSCHSTYVPAKYQSKAVFQIFDVNHRIGNEGWTVTLACKMRSTLDNVITGFETLAQLKQKQLKNYTDKATMNEKKRMNQIATRGAKRSQMARNFPDATGISTLSRLPNPLDDE